MSQRRRGSRSRRGQSSAIGIIFLMMAFILLFSFMTDVYKSQLTATQQDAEKAQEDAQISYLLMGGVSSNYPADQDASSGFQTVDQNYVTLQSQTGYLQQRPISNMNFTSSETGWAFTTDALLGASKGYSTDDGQPSPGSGPGMIYCSLAGMNLGPNWLNWTYYFTYSGGQPVSAYLSWAWAVADWTQIHTSTIYVTLSRPNSQTPVTIKTAPANDSSLGQWTRQTSLSIAPSVFTTSGQYKLSLALRAHTQGVFGKIRIFFDDVGILLNYRSGWVSDWSRTFSLSESLDSLTKLNIQYTGHYSPGTRPATYSSSSGTPLNGTATTSGSYASLAGRDSTLWKLQGNGAVPALDAGNPTAYTLLGSTTLVSGTISNLAANDGQYMTLRSYPITQVVSYNPTSYNLLGQTYYVSGSTFNLVSHDSNYMVFNSYPSAFSSTSLSEATITYRSSTSSGTSYPKSRTWDGSSWSSESEMATAGSSVWWVREAYCPISARYYEKIVVTLSSDGYLDAYVWNRDSWSVTNDIGYVGTTANAYRTFDITYEQTSGRAMLVYGISSSNTARDLAYRIWDGTSWSAENYIDDDGHATNIQIYWVELASKPMSGSNEIALLYTDGTDSHVDAFIWNGSGWGNRNELTTAVSSTAQEALAAAYEQTTGNLMIVAGEGQNIKWNRWTGSWGTSATFDINSGATGNMYWLALKTDPTSASNMLVLTSVDASTDLCTSRWTGSAWTDNTIHDTSVDVSAQRCADAEWEPAGSKILLVYGTSSGSISYKTWSSGTWSSASTVSNSGTHLWVQLRRNPRSVSGDSKILGAAMNYYYSYPSYYYAVYGLKWDGTTLTVSSSFTSSQTVGTYECFEVGYQNIGDPTEYTSEVEFYGTSDSSTWSQFSWLVGTAWGIGSVSVALSLYNFTAAAYSTSGNGFISYTSSATASTYEEQTQTIMTNPSDFRDAGNNWRIKVKGVKATTSAFLSGVDWLEYKPTWINGYESEVELTGTANTYTWTQLQWSLDSVWTAGSVQTTIQVYNYTLGAYPTSGDGYLSYTSSATPNTDETSTETLTVNPQTFRDASGNWKIKVTGYKAGTTQFDFKADWAEYKDTHYTHYASDWEAGFIISQRPSNITQLDLSYYGNYTANAISQSMYLWNFSSSRWVQLGSADSYSGAGQFQNRTITAGIASLMDSAGNITIAIHGQKDTSNQFSTYANYLALTVTTRAASTSISQTMYIWNIATNQWEALSTTTIGETDKQQGPIEITANIYHYVNATGGLKLRILGESTNVMSCSADQLVVTDYYKNRTKLTADITNLGSSKLEVVALWIINTTYHERVAVNPTITLVPGQTATYILTGTYFSTSTYQIKMVTQRGNVETYTIPYTE